MAICEGEECHLHVLNDFCFNLKSSNVCVFGLKGRKVLLLAESDCAAAASEKRSNGSKGQQSVRGRVVRSPRCQFVDPLLQRTDICVFLLRRREETVLAPPAMKKAAGAIRSSDHTDCFENEQTHSRCQSAFITNTHRQMSHHCMFLFIHRAFSTSVQVINQTETKINQKRKVCRGRL